MESLLKRFKTFVGGFVTPLFVVDSTPPTPTDGASVPAQIDRDDGGIKVHVTNSAAIGGDGASETTAAEILTAVESLDDKSLSVLGTTLNVQAGTSNTNSTAFASANYPRGFAVANLSTTNTIWVYQGVATVGAGWPIYPESIQAFELTNPNVLQHITESGNAAFRVGAVT